MKQAQPNLEPMNRDLCEPLSPESPSPPAMTAEQARDLLATEQKNRVEQCGEALRDVLQAHGCTLEAKVTILGSRVTGEVLIVPV